MKINIFLRKKLITPLIILLSGYVMHFPAFAVAFGCQSNNITCEATAQETSVYLFPPEYPVHTSNSTHTWSNDESDEPVVDLTLGTYTINWTLTDNTTSEVTYTEEQIITIEDTTGPEIEILTTTIEVNDGPIVIVLHGESAYEAITPDMLNIEVYDNVDGLLTFTLEQEAPQLGVKIVQLAAEDSRGNQTILEALVVITPKVSFGEDQLVLNEGQFEIPIFYNNLSILPSLVAVNFSGTASTKLGLNNKEYILFDDLSETSNKAIPIDSITIDIPSGVSLSSNDNLNVRFLTDDEYQSGETYEYESDNNTTVELPFIVSTPEDPNDELVISFTDQNVAPNVELVAFEGNLCLDSPLGPIKAAKISCDYQYSEIFTKDSFVVIEANITDINNDTHNVEWFVSGLKESDYNTYGNELTFYTINATENIITAYAIVTESDTDEKFQVRADIKLVITNEDTSIILSSNTDTDGDGIDDQDEGQGDSDRDGIPDYLDNIYDQSNVLPIGENNDPMQTTLGLTLKLGLTKLSAEALTADNASISQANLQNNGDNGSALTSDNSTDDRYSTQVTPIIDFEISGFTAGESVSVVIPLPDDTSIPKDAAYRKYTAEDGWKDFISDAENSISSASRNSSDACPAADDDASYTIGLRVGHQCVRVIIEDGGPNDADNTSNGTIVDPGVIAVYQAPATNSGTPTPTTTTVTTITTTEGKSGGSTGLFVLLLLPLMLFRKIKK